MRTNLFAWIVFCLIFAGVGCSGDESAATPTATAVSQVIVPTETAVPPTATTEPTPVVTETAVPPPTTTPTPAPTLPPPPTGQIIYFWDPEYPLDNYGIEPYQSLYLAQPGNSPTNWTITPILSDLVGFPVVAMSPDRSKLALTILEDRNNDGVTSFGSYQRGGDDHNLYIYSLSDHSLKRLTEDYPTASYLSWSPDSQEITFPNDSLVLSYNLTTENSQILSENHSGGVAQVAWSPMGSQLAFKLYSGSLYFLDKETNEVTQPPDDDANSRTLGIAWSPDGQWLASNIFMGTGLVVVNSNHYETIEFIPQTFFGTYAWSPVSSDLAFVRFLREGGASLEVASAVDFVPKILFEANNISSPLWTPDGSMITIGYMNEVESGLLIFASESGDFQQLLESNHEIETHPFSWSPDGEWLLFSQTQSEESGLYLIHRQGGKPYLLLDTTGTVLPYFVNWLPNNTFAP